MGSWYLWSLLLLPKSMISMVCWSMTFCRLRWGKGNFDCLRWNFLCKNGRPRPAGARHHPSHYQSCEAELILISFESDLICWRAFLQFPDLTFQQNAKTRVPQHDSATGFLSKRSFWHWKPSRAVSEYFRVAATVYYLLDLMPITHVEANKV